MGFGGQGFCWNFQNTGTAMSQQVVGACQGCVTDLLNRGVDAAAKKVISFGRIVACGRLPDLNRSESLSEGTSVLSAFA